MNKLNYLLNYLLCTLGILSLLAYFPLLIYIGVAGEKQIDGQYRELILFSTMFAPLILGFILLGIASSGFGKTKKVRLENQLEKSEKLSQMEAHELLKLRAESANYSSEEIEKMRKKVLESGNNLAWVWFFILIAIFVGQPVIFLLSPIINLIPKDYQTIILWGILLSIVLLSIVISIKGISFNKEKHRLELIIKTWILENKIKIPHLSNLQFVPKKIIQKLRSVFFISKMCQLNSNLSGFEIDEMITFQYKGKTVELIDFEIGPISNNSRPCSYLCLTTSNPDETKGQTVAWHDSNWRFKDEKLSEKVRTESPVFDRIFKTFATNPITARMHLNTSIMQNMINFQEILTKKNVVFYFDDSQIYIIFKTVSNSLEIDINQHLDQLSDTNLKTDIELTLKIFDEFWLSRKSGFYENGNYSKLSSFKNS